MVYMGSMDMGNFFVIPESPSEVWYSEQYMAKPFMR
jgi:hypothetical protein